MADKVSTDDYSHQLKALLPQGPALPREKDTTEAALVDALAAEYTRVHNRDLELLDEMLPMTTAEMLPDWERVAGLPEDCTGAFNTLDQRRRALLTKLATRGGQSVEYFTEIAAIFGWTIEVTEYPRFRAGGSVAGAALTNDQGDGYGWVYVWRVKADSPVSTFKASGAAAGEPLASWGNSPLECLLNKWKPAHTIIIFDYS